MERKSSRQPRGKCLLAATGAGVTLLLPRGAGGAIRGGVCGRREGVPLAFGAWGQRSGMLFTHPRVPVTEEPWPRL